jgi:hypothetical protein
MTGYKTIEDVEKIIAIIKTRGKLNGKKYIHCSDCIEAVYELNDGEFEHDEDIEDELE